MCINRYTKVEYLLGIYKWGYGPFCMSLLTDRLAKFRVGSHDLEIERGRYAKVPANERFCKLCLTLNENRIEDEYHVLLKCPFYEDFRKIYLCFNNDPLNLHTFVNIMCTQSQEEIVQLACFISSMFKLRYCYLYSV